MIRFDITNTLIHLTRERNDLSAKEVFKKILNEKKILGSIDNIRGKSRCVCFSETPISAIGQIIVQEDDRFKYGPYGFMFTKKNLFDLGARPVIYQPESDFGILPEELKYRHVRFEIEKTDYTWEREWRMKTDFINLDSSNVTLIVS
ncbi:MAG: hypothetical protein GXO80_11320 [Chlorobi bacterium]|nr:hypothetical protein [Chlorobiota bacterium]